MSFATVQDYEIELTGSQSMSISDFYRDSFVQFGYPEQEVDNVIATACTDDYHALVAILHAREPEVAGAASRESAQSDSPTSPLLQLLGSIEFSHSHTPAARAGGGLRHACVPAGH